MSSNTAQLRSCSSFFLNKKKAKKKGYWFLHKIEEHQNKGAVAIHLMTQD